MKHRTVFDALNKLHDSSTRKAFALKMNCLRFLLKKLDDVAAYRLWFYIFIENA